MRMSISLMSYSREVHGLDIVFGYNDAEGSHGLPLDAYTLIDPYRTWATYERVYNFPDLKSMLI